MGTSLFNDGLVAMAASLYGTDDDPMDATIMRDVVLHGLLHAADSMAQVRVNYHPIDAGVDEGQSTFETIEASPTTSQYYRVGAAPFGPWPLTVRSNGEGYKLRIRIGGAHSNGGGAATVSFLVIIAPMRPLSTGEIIGLSDSIFLAQTTSTTPVWLTGASRGSVASATMLTITPEEVAAWTAEGEAYNAVASGAPRSLRQVLVAAHVFAYTTVAASLPQLHALHVAEFVGAT